MTEGPVFVARMTPDGAAFPAPSGQTLLASALAAGLAPASSCRNGTCRTCLLPLRAGQVAYRIPWPGLLPEERTGGWVLPCVAYPLTDVVMGGAPAGAQELPVR